MLENFGKYKNKTKKKQVILLSFLSVSRFRSLGKFRKMKLKIFGRQNIFSTHTLAHTRTNTHSRQFGATLAQPIDLMAGAA